ncbi:MAG TPA: hypothetical protein VHX66_15715 [Solirubrobacteraceae bacterium]|jgi:cell wall-associated NlpC family hydrolase|nr:hypothetical protein [Solirubrobacteraceae bacterium]
MNSPAQALHLPRRRMSLLALASAALLAAAVVAIVLATQGSPRPAPHHGTLVAEAPDPLASQSYPDPAGARTHARAAAPSVAAAAATASPGAPSITKVKRELAQQRKLERELGSNRHGTYIDPATGAFSPANVVPTQIAEVIAGGNAIADFPYVYGGGHGSFVDRAYDCSGSVSYALAAAGLIAVPETSGQLEHWGKPGPGRWLTVFANAGHTFMNVDGVWFDTAGRSGPYSTRWLIPQPDVNGYVERHYPGL